MIIDPATALAFVGIKMGFALVPGPDLVLIISQSVARGARGGRVAYLGILWNAAGLRMALSTQRP